MLKFYQPERDFGTPVSLSETLVTLTIDGMDAQRLSGLLHHAGGGGHGGSNPD